MDSMQTLSEQEMAWLEDARQEELFTDPVLRATRQINEIDALLNQAPSACCGGQGGHACCGRHQHRQEGE